MRTINNILLAAGIIILSACSSDIEEISPTTSDDSQTINTAVLRLEGHIQHFDGDQAATRAATSEWDDGAKLYIQYETTNGRVDGIATYSLNTDEWEVQYYGTINRGEVSKCEVYYFENAVSATLASVELNGYSAIFADKQASYDYDGSVVKLKTNLRPQTGRIRFRGKAGTSITFIGLKWYTGYSISNNTLSQIASDQTLTVASDGFTPYVYGFFADAATSQLTVDSGEKDCAFRKTFGNDVLLVGESGYIDIPTITSRNGWQVIESYPLGLCPDENHPHMIDMGIGVMFACCNVGAKTPLEYGGYYAWGETKTKSVYDWSNYKWCNDDSGDYMTKYCDNSSQGKVDNKTQLVWSDDAAHANWGGTWRMPSIDELSALKNKCTWTWISLSGVKGCKVIAPNGNVLFLPAAGSYANCYDGFIAVGMEGVYWSSSVCSGIDYYCNVSYCLIFASDHPSSPFDIERCDGLSVRPVTE